MSKMLRTHQNTIGNLVIALLFVGGCIFLLTGSWDASESEAAKGCCGGDTTATSCCGGGATLVAATTNGCCGSTERLSDSDDDYNCNCLDTDNEDADCGDCYVDPDNADSECSGANTQTCTDDCARTYCGEGGSFCNSTDFETYCPNDGVTDEYGCEGGASGCSNEID